MTNEQLQSFYEAAVLPQFGIGASLKWEASQRLEFNELAFRFRADGHTFILIFEDHFGLGKDRIFIEKQLGLREGDYEFVHPASQELKESSPSYTGFKLPVPYKYCEGVTGSFTLLRMLPQGDGLF